MRGTFTKLIAAAAVLATPAMASAQPDAGYTVVPAADRLTFGGVFADASIEMKLLMLVLIAGLVAALVRWAMGLQRLKAADAAGVAGAVGFLRMVGAGGALLGLAGAAYVLLAGFIGVSNVRPTPSFTVMAPGYAEAALTVLLGLLASAAGVMCAKHLEGRLRVASLAA
jgi:hypothetical protein